MKKNYDLFLDNVILAYIAKTRFEHQEYDFRDLSRVFKTTPNENIASHKKLISDGYIEKMESKAYLVTIKCLEFINKGGYSSEKKRKNRIKAGKIIVSIITIICLLIGAVYAGVEIYKFYHNCNCDTINEH